MADVTVTIIGQGSFVRGRVSGSGDLEIAGRVDGEVHVSGDLLVDAHGLVSANVAARRLTVRGAVKGDLSATEAVSLEAGARVVGDVRAPRVSIAPGALVRGHVQTGAADAKRASSAHAKPAARPAQAPPSSAPATKSVPSSFVKSAASTKPGGGAKSGKTLPRGAMLAGTKQPPPPVVPSIKKGAKAVHKKRA